jgi:hypothetical protein
VLPILGGFLIDKFGVRKMVIIYASMFVLGSLIVAIGAWLRSFPIMGAGRFIFG